MPGATEIDGLIAARLAEGWSLERLDRPMRAILRAGAYELVARADVPVARSSPNMSTSPTPFTTSARAASSTACSTPIAKEAAAARGRRLSARSAKSSSG